ERWRDRVSWERHMRSPHMDAFRANAGHLIGAFELLHLHQVA
ncbi:antibiotic biosynthesis monooxygenase, partial [Azotobacter chroococcum]